MNITGKYLKVWKIESQNGFTKLNLGDSTKKQDGTYHNWTWFGCALMGKAKDIQVQEGDVIEVLSGLIEQNEYNGKWYTNIKIFDFNVQQSDNKKDAEGFVNADDGFDDEDIPF